MILVISIIILLLILIWNITIKKNYTSPLIFWCGIWLVSTFFVWLNPYDMIEISNKAIWIITLGIFSFCLGTYKLTKYKYIINTNIKLNFWKRDNFNNIVCYTLLGTTLIFNIVLTIDALKMMRNGMLYSSIRDVLFSYGDNSFSFFKSTFMSTFYSWIVGPSMSALLILLIINIIFKKLPKIFNFVTFIDICLYIFSNSGRMILMHTVFHIFFLYKYYGYKMPKKYKKKALIGIFMVAIALLAITFFRIKNVVSVPTIYSYFSIDYPLLSYWINYVDTIGQKFYGNGFFRGILEGVNFFLRKIDMATPLFWDMQEIFDLIQNRWIEIFPKNWYNAYVSIFFYYYIDFGILGVISGSYIFGKVASIIYDVMKRENTLLAIMIYMLIIQVIGDSFIRWQFGNFATVATAFLLFISVKNGKKKINIEEV